MNSVNHSLTRLMARSPFPLIAWPLATASNTSVAKNLSWFSQEFELIQGKIKLMREH
jgi:hypothetical protein